MTNAQLFDFIGKSLVIDYFPEYRLHIVAKINENCINWNHFVWMSSGYLVLPAIYVKYRDAHLLPHLPEDLVEHLETLYQLNKERNEGILAQTERLIETFNKHDIEPIFMKGSSHLLSKLYSDTGERFMGDIDLLVPQKDFLKAANLLLDEGYYIGHEIREEEYSLNHHFPTLIHDELPGCVEIHQEPLHMNSKKHLTSTMVQQAKQCLPGKLNAFLLSDKHQIIQNFIHAQISDSGHAMGMCSLRALYDFHLLERQFCPKHVNFKNRSLKRKFEIYQSMAHHIFLPANLQNDPLLSAAIYLKRHRTLLNSPRLAKLTKVAVISRKRLQRYLHVIYLALTRKEGRVYLKRRLGNRAWYREHLNHYLTQIR